MFSLISSFFGVLRPQVWIGITLVILIPIFFQVHSCNQKRKDEAVTEHYNKKFENQLKEDQNILESYVERRKKENNKKAGKKEPPKLTEEEIKERTKKSLEELEDLAK